METFSALLALCAGNSPVPVNSPHKGQWRGALMFSLICARIKVWVNNGEASNLRRNRAHYDVTVMSEWMAMGIPLKTDWTKIVKALDISLHKIVLVGVSRCFGAYGQNATMPLTLTALFLTLSQVICQGLSGRSQKNNYCFITVTSHLE